MTVEIRTNPPTAQLGIDGPHTVFLMCDPFEERKNQDEVSRRIMATHPRLPRIDSDGNLDVADNDRYNAELKRWNVKTLNAVSVFIDGLDEQLLATNIRAFQDAVDQGRDLSGFSKGTRFGGKNKGSMNSVIAFLLKSALPPGLSVKIGVKVRWELEDLVRYGAEIREALARQGTPQPQRGYSGASGGLLKGFGIFKV